MAGKVRREIAVESHPYTGLVLYEVSLDDLNQLESELVSVGEDFSFALFCITTAISFTVTLATVDIAAGKLYNVFWIITIIGYLGAVYFGVRWYKTRSKVKSTIKRIKERVGSLGEEGKEIDPEQLENLPPAEASS
jgi:hypothetical protein